MPMWGEICAHVLESPKRPMEGVSVLELQIGCCESKNMGSKNRAQALCKSKKHSALMSLSLQPHFFLFTYHVSQATMIRAPLRSRMKC